MNARTETPTLFDYLPPEIRKIIYSYCPLNALGLFAQTSRKNRIDVTQSVLLKLLSFAVNAEPVSYYQENSTKLAAIAILKKNPSLLFEKNRLKDHLGRPIFASAYGVFLGAGDIWALKQIHEEIIANIKDENARWLVEEQAQMEFRAQFPNCPWPLEPDLTEEALYDDRNKMQLEQVKTQLKIVIEKITNDPCTKSQATNIETERAVKDLWEIFAARESEIIKTGLHFPLGILKDIWEEYEAQYSLLSTDQATFFCREIIGKVQAALSAVDGQCLKQGLVNLDMKNGPNRNDGLFCNHPQGFLGKLLNLGSKLGKTMFVDIYYGCVSADIGSHFWIDKTSQYERITPCIPKASQEHFVKLRSNMENKNKEIIELMRSLQGKQSNSINIRRC